MEKVCTIDPDVKPKTPQATTPCTEEEGFTYPVCHFSLVKLKSHGGRCWKYDCLVWPNKEEAAVQDQGCVTDYDPETDQQETNCYCNNDTPYCDPYIDFLRYKRRTQLSL